MTSFPRLLPILLSIFLQGCLATWMRMEDGTVLAPGKSDFAMAIGTVPRPEYRCDIGYDGTDSLGRRVCEDWSYAQADVANPFGYQGTRTLYPVRVVVNREPHFALAWRLGALSAFGPFTGLELGIQAEGATNPVSQEYRLALGLPGSDSILAHSLIGGWGTGIWADNSWFLQYAASRRFGSLLWYGSARGTLQATQMQNLFDFDLLKHKRTMDFQVATGVKAQLPPIDVVPDWISFGTTVNLGHGGYPSFDSDGGEQDKGIGVAWGVGMGWGW
jgi:hypothetical protein